MTENEHTKKNRNAGIAAQAILDAGLNVFALRLLIESYTDLPKPKPISFPFLGVNISLSLCSDERITHGLPRCPTCGKPEDVEIDKNGKVHILRLEQ